MDNSYMVLDWFWNDNAPWFPVAFTFIMTLSSICFAKRFLGEDVVCVLVVLTAVPLVPTAWFFLAMAPFLLISVFSILVISAKIVNAIPVKGK